MWGFNFFNPKNKNQPNFEKTEIKPNLAEKHGKERVKELESEYRRIRYFKWFLVIIILFITFYIIFLFVLNKVTWVSDSSSY